VLLSIWSWDRLPVGRPRNVSFKDWDDKETMLRQATWAYKWDVVSEMMNDVEIMYKQYINELDTLTPEQVSIVVTCMIAFILLN
jgi:hypothetical protein